jgi:uncharacterized protein (TIGR02391 family)
MEQDDNFQYWGVNLYPDTVKFFVDGLRFYSGLLKRDLESLQDDPELSILLDVKGAQSPIQRELERTNHAIAWLDSQWDKDVHGLGAMVNISHGSVRFLKSIGLAYLSHLRGQRNARAGRSVASERVLGEIDRQLARYEEKMQMGVFGGATPKPLVTSELPTPTESTVPQNVLPTPPPIVLSGIEILDPELNARCLDLFNTFVQNSQADRFDTVVMEATKILEHRLRQTANLDSSHDGVKLVTAALGSTAPLIALSPHQSEQEAAHLLFRGVFGFIRNPFHHRLMGTVAQQRVLQILGTVDYLLYLLESSQSIKKS